MRKLTLELDDLAVESFATVVAPDEAGGTVQGHMATNGNGSACSNHFSCAVGCTDQVSCAMPCTTA